jgi:hypothetical protein
VRGALGLSALILTLSCASSVSRLPGEPVTPLGPPRGECETDGWLTIVKTRSQEPTANGRTTQPRDDGLGLYRVGGSDPESIPSLADELGPSPLFLHHTEAVKRHDGKRWLAASLGGAGLIILGIGAYFFATSFETVQTTAADGSRDEKQEIDGTRIAVGSILLGTGFGLGIAGLVVNPSAADRARADQKRYVFLPSEDNPKEVSSVVEKNNRRVRSQCVSAAR